MITLHHDDCLELLPAIPDHSIDMILCDLPYGTTACKWDVVIPFAPLWEQYRRIIKPRGAIVLFARQPFTTDLIISNRPWYKYSWVWEKTMPSGFMQSKHRPLIAHEDIVVFSEGTVANCSKRLMPYTPQVDYSRGGYKKFNYSGSRAKSSSNVGIRPSFKDGLREKDCYQPRSVLKFSNGNHGSLHVTQKPVDLLEYLIKTYTQEGETVLDNCMGSGSTGVACLNTNRSFIGMEKDAQYYQIAVDRINATQPVLAAGRDGGILADEAAGDCAGGLGSRWSAGLVADDDAGRIEALGRRQPGDAPGLPRDASGERGGD
jgi:site-specific DNA-methyltransferase (adenine-specific)